MALFSRKKKYVHVSPYIAVCKMNIVSHLIIQIIYRCIEKSIDMCDIKFGDESNNE